MDRMNFRVTFEQCQDLISVLDAAITRADDPRRAARLVRLHNRIADVMTRRWPDDDAAPSQRPVPHGH